MDPIAAIALICNVFDLTERTIKCIKKVKEAYNSTTGLPEDREKLSNSTHQLTTILSEIQSSHGQLQLLRIDDINIQILADTCQEFSSKIITLLDRCASKKPRSTMGALKATTRTLFDKHSLQALKDDLDKTNKKNKSRVGEFAEALDRGHVENSSLKRQVGDIISKLNTFENLPAQLQEVSSLCLQAQRTEFLRTFGDNNARYDDVPDAFANTFDWILREPKKLFELEPGSELTFVDWLRDGEDIFHILGKPGSGKSTLMKFIWRHEVTKAMLRKWAGQSRLLSMRYFFWKPSPSQNGLRSLKCSLLKSALEQAPELMKVFFPGSSNHGAWLDTRMAGGTSEIEEQISQAFDLFMSSPQTLGSYKVFLLIDGLDEFDEDSNTEDYYDLVRVIRTWTSQSDGKVKACVSSREYEAFTTITRNQKIRLQNLTRKDMQLTSVGAEGHTMCANLTAW
ncbi:hypothetical protein F4677DRAFT_440907 [Hypoxylon crocopeplum]|nr:hypothetical protein F4677DRAFT_440907 [Hypoxylon crocopeplum]